MHILEVYVFFDLICIKNGSPCDPFFFINRGPFTVSRQVAQPLGGLVEAAAVRPGPGQDLRDARALCHGAP